MLISIIVPAYNCVNTLKLTIESILQSGLCDYEIILIDDGSEDGSAQLCDKLSEESEIIRCIHQNNSGVSVTRNRGIDLALGEYIMFFDSDDTVDSGSLGHVAGIIIDKQPDMIIFGLSFDFYCHGRLYKREEHVYRKEGMMSSTEWGKELLDLYNDNALSPAWNKLIKKEIIEKNQLKFQPELIEMEDFVFSINCMGYCENVYFLSEAIYRYRQTENGRNTYNRLLRIPSLTAYMSCFENALSELAERINIKCERKNEILSITGQIYKNFFYEMIYYGSREVIIYNSGDLLNGKFAMLIHNEDPLLYQWIEEKRYCRIWTDSFIKRARHWIAVRVQLLCSVRG